MAGLRLSGRVVTGIGQGASFTQISWARQQFVEELGIDPYPGTLNLRLDTARDRARWAALKSMTSCQIIPPDPQWCEADCYPVRINGRLPGAIVRPDVPAYPPDQIEVVAALSLRDQLSLRDGDRLDLEVVQPLAVSAVIFDVDGTLVDSVEAYHVLAQKAAQPYGISIPREIVIYALNVNHPTFWDLVVPADRPDQAELMLQLNRSARQLWPAVLAEHGAIFPGLRETLASLKEDNLELGIVTGSQGGSLRPLRAAGLTDYFEVIITAGDVQQRKPDPEGLLKCLASLEVRPDEAVYVGDTAVDVRAGRAAGMASVAVLSGAGDSALLSVEGPDRIIRDHSRLEDVLAPANGG